MHTSFHDPHIHILHNPSRTRTGCGCHRICYAPFLSAYNTIIRHSYMYVLQFARWRLRMCWRVSCIMIMAKKMQSCELANALTHDVAFIRKYFIIHLNAKDSAQFSFCKIVNAIHTRPSNET